MRSLALANQKGGVGKTTTAIHLAHGLAISGARVALFDMDPQGNATVALQGMEFGDDTPQKPPFDVLRQVSAGFWLLPSPGAERSISRDAVIDLAKLKSLVTRLKAAGMDWLVVDCPPRMDQWGWAGLQLCQQVIVPVQSEFFALHGLSQMMATLEQVRAEHEGCGELHAVLPTMVQAAEPVSLEVVQDLRGSMPGQVFDTVIFRDSTLVEAASHGRTAFSYNPMCKGALCYAELVREVIDGGPQVR